MPGFKTTVYANSDRRWLGTTSTLKSAKTGKLHVSDFPTNPNGFIPSGTAVAKHQDGYLVPYVTAANTTTGAGVLYGLLATDCVVNGDELQAVAVLDSGRVIEAYLPPASKPLNLDVAAKAARTQFIVEN